MEIKPPEYSYIHFSDEETSAIDKVADILLELREPNIFDGTGTHTKPFNNKFEIRCLDNYCECESVYNDFDIYKAYRMMAEFLEDTLEYYPQNEEENANEN